MSTTTTDYTGKASDITASPDEGNDPSTTTIDYGLELTSDISPAPDHDDPPLLTLPPEIWLQVFPHLRSDDLQAASLTCSGFRYMAQPLLFSVLDVSPFFLSYNAEQPVRRPQKYLHRVLERLEYYKLPHLAHGVRHCWISPYSRHGFPERNQWDDLDPSLVINPLINSLSSFPNLESLSWHCIDIATEWWTSIQSLRLKKLWINSSLAPLDATPLSFVVHLDLDQWPWEGRVTNHVSIHEERAHGIDLPTLQHIIHPEVTKSISVPRVDTACRLLSALSETAHQLGTLKIPFTCMGSEDFITALQQCPNLEVLCIFPPSTDDQSKDIQLEKIPPNALPSLLTYEGPCTHVLDFSGRPLERIYLWGFDERPTLCDPDALIDILMELAETECVDTLKSLQLSVTTINIGLLDVISSFHNMEEICVQSQDSSSRAFTDPHTVRWNSPVSTLYTILTSLSIPPKLRRMKFDTRLSGANLDLESQEREAAEFMETFAAVHPAVQIMEITYGVYWTGIYSATWGRLRSNGDLITIQRDEGTKDVGEGDPVSTETGPNENGYSSKSSSRDCLMSTVVSTVHPLPLGKLTFTEHRRTILFPQGNKPGISVHGGVMMADGMGHFRYETGYWVMLWTRLKKLFGKYSI